jgi:hypothetical protein
VSTRTGEFNFNPLDLEDARFKGQSVYVSRQSFYDRSKEKGVIATIDDNNNYVAYLNPVPAKNSKVLLKIANYPYLSVSYFNNEAQMVVPTSSEVAHVALDTGRVLVASDPKFQGLEIVYDGLILQSLTLSQIPVGLVSDTNVRDAVYVGINPKFRNVTDSSRFVFYAKKTGETNYYFNTEIVEEDEPVLDSGVVAINSKNGKVWLNATNDRDVYGYEIIAVDTYLSIEKGVTVQVYRSAVNGPGNPVVPDFIEYYRINDSVISDGLGSSPFLPIPAKPLQTPYIGFRIDQNAGGSGTFIGDLVDATNPSQQGFGYLLDINSSQFKFSNRKTVTKTLPSPSSFLKLDDSVVFSQGISGKFNGLPVDEGTDYSFDKNSGLITFLESVGEGSAINKSNINGAIQDERTFVATSDVFSNSDTNAFAVINAGLNAGVYKILSVPNSKTIKINGPFRSLGPATIDVKPTYETIADNFWEILNPPMKKFVVSRASSISAPLQVLSESEYRVIASSGQVSLIRPSDPGCVYFVRYTATISTTGGISYEEKDFEEYLASKIQLETASYTSGSNTVFFNRNGLTVIPERGFTVYVDGVEYSVTSSNFEAPNKLILPNIFTNQRITVTYYVAESPGGNRSFNTQYSPVILDKPTFIATTNSLVLNGDLSNSIKVGGVVYYLDKYLLPVQSVVYDSTSDTTKLEFISEIQFDYAGEFKVCDPITFTDVQEFSTATVAQNQTSITINATLDLKPGQFIKLDDDLFLIIASEIGADLKTTVSVSNAASRNYLFPEVRFSLGTVTDPPTLLSTKKSAITSSPFNLFLISNSPRLLNSPADYIVSDGGQIKLASSLQRGHSLLAFYVARKTLPAGTIINLNYACSLSPNDSNGLIDQRLIGKFDLYGPDSFYYRIETVLSYVPEVSQAVSSSTNQTSSGPITSYSVSLNLKSRGIPSLYFDEQRYANLDLVTKRLLLYYNDLTNGLEDNLANYDGRIIGGLSGKFKFNLSEGVDRDNPAAIRNDIDDRIFVYDEFQLVSFFDIESVKIYKPLYDYSQYSRLFPTSANRNFVFNDKTDADSELRGQVIGNVGLTNLVDIKTIVSARSSFRFKRISDTVVQIGSNGDSTALNPPFKQKAPVSIFSDDGTFVGSNIIISVAGDAPCVITLQDPVAVNVGGIVLNNQIKNDSNDESLYQDNRFYNPSRDFDINYDTGEIKNDLYDFLQFLDIQDVVYPNEVLSSRVDYTNVSTTPKKIPALFGGTDNDNGFYPVPPVHFMSESDYTTDEVEYLNNSNNFGKAAIFPDKITLTNPSLPTLKSGERITFISGSNSGETRTVDQVVSSTKFTVTAPFTSATPSPESFVKSSEYESYLSTLDSLVRVLSTNQHIPITPPSQIPKPANELAVLDYVARYFGQNLISSTAMLDGDTLTDSTQTFTVSDLTYVYVTSGPNLGFYKVTGSNGNILTVSTNSPYYGFSTLDTAPYILLNRYTFMTDLIPQYLATAFATTNTFLDQTVNWRSGVDLTDKTTRLNQLGVRSQNRDDLIGLIENLCKSGDSLYNRRFLWISQRTDKTNGFITKKNLSTLNREESTQKFIENQQKRLMLQAMASL